MKTLLLDTAGWDLKVDASGNIETADDPYAIAQDVASACRLFLGELWYDTTQGVPYLQSILGKSPPVSFMQAKFAASALTVPEVTAVSVALNPVGSDRELTGTLTLTSASGATAIVVSAGGVPWYVQAISPGQGVAGNPFLLDISLLSGPDALV